MTLGTQIKEEFYIRRAFDDAAPIFVDATKYAIRELPYQLSAKRSLKATCGVRTDDEVVAFSLRNYTIKQAEKEVENVGAETEGKVTAQNLLRARMPRKTLHELNEGARSLSADLNADELIVELDGSRYVLGLRRSGTSAELELAGRLDEAENGHIRNAMTDEDVEFQLPITGVRLRIFLRSPVRQRILAFGFMGYLTRKPGEMETVIRATALALNSILGLATFRMLSGLNHVEVPVPLPGTAVRPRTPEERVMFTVPVLLFTGDGTPAARGQMEAEIDLDQVDPVSGELRIKVEEGDDLEWNPAVTGSVRFDSYARVLTESVGALVRSALGADVVRDIAYDIMLSDVAPEALDGLRAATADLPELAAKPGEAQVRQAQTSPAPAA